MAGIYKDKEKRKQYLKDYQKRYMHQYRIKLKKLGIKPKWRSDIYHKEVRLKALDLLGGRLCSNCGCDVEDILEINHKYGGGTKDRKNTSTGKFYRDIVSKKIDISLYNVLCKLCNIHHYIETLKGIKGHKVIWNKPL